jgi:hypothetical protein
VRQIHPREAFAYEQVKVVHRTSTNTDEDLVLTRPRIGYILIGENFRSTELMNADCFHEGSCLTCRVIPYLELGLIWKCTKDL